MVYAKIVKEMKRLTIDSPIFACIAMQAVVSTLPKDSVTKGKNSQYVLQQKADLMSCKREIIR